MNQSKLTRALKTFSLLIGPAILTGIVLFVLIPIGNPWSGRKRDRVVWWLVVNPSIAGLQSLSLATGFLALARVKGTVRGRLVLYPSLLVSVVISQLLFPGLRVLHSGPFDFLGPLCYAWTVIVTHISMFAALSVAGKEFTVRSDVSVHQQRQQQQQQQQDTAGAAAVELPAGTSLGGAKRHRSSRHADASMSDRLLRFYHLRFVLMTVLFVVPFQLVMCLWVVFVGFKAEIQDQVGKTASTACFAIIYGAFELTTWGMYKGTHKMTTIYDHLPAQVFGKLYITTAKDFFFVIVYPGLASNVWLLPFLWLLKTASKLGGLIKMTLCWAQFKAGIFKFFSCLVGKKLLKSEVEHRDLNPDDRGLINQIPGYRRRALRFILYKLFSQFAANVTWLAVIPLLSRTWNADRYFTECDDDDGNDGEVCKSTADQPTNSLWPDNYAYGIPDRDMDLAIGYAAVMAMSAVGGCVLVLAVCRRQWPTTYREVVLGEHQTSLGVPIDVLPRRLLVLHGSKGELQQSGVTPAGASMPSAPFEVIGDGDKPRRGSQVAGAVAESDERGAAAESAATLSDPARSGEAAVLRNVEDTVVVDVPGQAQMHETPSANIPAARSASNALVAAGSDSIHTEPTQKAPDKHAMSAGLEDAGAVQGTGEVLHTTEQWALPEHLCWLIISTLVGNFCWAMMYAQSYYQVAFL